MSDVRRGMPLRLPTPTDLPSICQLRPSNTPARLRFVILACLVLPPHRLPLLPQQPLHTLKTDPTPKTYSSPEAPSNPRSANVKTSPCPASLRPVFSIAHLLIGQFSCSIPVDNPFRMFSFSLSSLVRFTLPLQYHTSPVQRHQQRTATLQRAQVGRRTCTCHR